jgi:hypothetical protein
VIKGKYRIDQSVIHAIRKRNKYSPAHDNKKAIILDNVSIVIDENKIAKFNKGDEVLLVYLNSREYPIIIEKKEAFSKT